MRTTEVDLTDFGGSIFVRELKASEVVEFSKKQSTDPSGAVYYLIVSATVDADGNQYFKSGDNVADLPYAVSDKLVESILILSGLKEKDDPKKK